MKVLREGPVKITKATIDAAWRRRAPGQRLMIADAECRGLALVVNPTGMTWRFDYKPRGIDAATGKRFASQSVTIGTPASHSIDAARDAAGAMKGQAKAGTDLAGERKAKIAASAERRSRTLDRLAEDYAKVLPKRPKLRGTGKLSPAHAAAELAHVKAAIADMKAGGKAVADIGASDLRALLRANAEQPGAARHRFGALSRFLDWCRDEGLIAVNPCTLIGKDRRPKAVPARQDYLKPDALAHLWKAAGEADKLDPVHRDYLRFLIAIPCRRTEAATLEWSHLDLDAGEWVQPGALTKNGDPHRLHLHPLALGLLRARHEAAGQPKAGLVFPAPRSGEALTTFSKLKAALDAKAERTGWRFHDFRRSFATALGEAGFAEPVVDAVLNHRQAATRGGVLGVYQRAVRWPEQVAAMTAWGEILTTAIEGKSPGAEKVVALSTGRRKVAGGVG
ncbi:MAG: tyrosine-type recombinase/integrase [Acetobacteraceae bacterium]|nr:tyrosine-type recombinase/integrase [Acetobacteraceae bacterium]